MSSAIQVALPACHF